VESGQVAPSRTSDVDNCQDVSWESDEGVEPVAMELEVGNLTFRYDCLSSVAMELEVGNLTR
jgi:hypothetical protein